ncbi:disintegrin and metalloproteinase domain-containing protein 10-like [Saccostrea cucullata]|uniref:disintegrin and metalloproteinase domain-containing protein 10-like n=1 Tax=Saccostrea cuccullata TaxID=36930 RepID=UPI002ED53154
MTYCNGYTHVCINGVRLFVMVLSVSESAIPIRHHVIHGVHHGMNATSGYGNDTCFVSDDSEIPEAFSKLVEDVKRLRKHTSPISVASGTPCNNYQGYCDVFHRCRGVDNEKPLEQLKNLIFGEETLTTIKNWIIEYWWGVMLIVVGIVIVMGVFIKVCSVNTPSKDPKLKTFRKKRIKRKEGR